LAEIKSFPNNQDVYVGAEWVMKWLHGRTSGVFGADENLAIFVVPDSMSIEVSDGIGWISNDKNDGVVFWNDKEQTDGNKLSLSVDVADSVYERIDRVVVTWETTNYVALPTISILKGAAARNPVPPGLTNNATQRQISLARIKIPAGTVSLSASMITDERLDSSVCGIVTEYIKIDTSTMQNQFDALLTSIQRELASIIGGTGFDPTPLRFENIVVNPESFSVFTAEDNVESGLISMGYKYRGDIVLSDVLESMFPYITLSLNDVKESGAGLSNQFRCYNGGLYMYSDKVPSSNIVALTMEFRKAAV
jgi:hypothetical protein